MTEAIVGKALGILIGFALGAAFMSWLGSGPAKALFSWKRKRKRKRKREDLWEAINCAVGERVPKKISDLNMNYRTGVPDCPICGGLGYTQSLFKAGQDICTCTFRKKLHDRVTGADTGDGTPEVRTDLKAWKRERDRVTDLLVKQSRMRVSLKVGVPVGVPDADPTGGDDPDLRRRTQAAIRSRLPFLDNSVEGADFIIATAEVIHSAIQADLEYLGVEAFMGDAHLKADMTGKVFRVPEVPMRAVWHEEGDPHLFDEFGHLLEGRGPVTIKTYGPRTGRLSSSGSNLPREDEITEHASTFRTGAPECENCQGEGVIRTMNSIERCRCTLSHRWDDHVDEFGGVEMGQDESDGEDEIERAK